MGTGIRNLDTGAFCSHVNFHKNFVFYLHCSIHSGIMSVVPGLGGISYEGYRYRSI